MRWFLAGCCVLGSIYLSAAVPQLTQRPRFFGAKTGSTVWIWCSKKTLSDIVRWYKDDTKGDVLRGERIKFHNKNMTKNSYLFIPNVTAEDSGVYYCEINNSLGSGTQVKVATTNNVVQAQYRTTLKDGLIIFQGLLLAFCISAILLRRQTMTEKKDSIYEDPETDHIYQGLAIESCGGGLYEELSVYAQADGAEAPWE
ncbi:B-cell antigen receptor complex-associated beta chain-like [Solea senegalensis]|uniref:B-cell antigen receptor complex-associated beta chain-like n=1 Tax=Solea senegalensis TaxID=28829 RepID=A0AAV6RQI0_SOLSE|nr:B-cell antigen receptor complex-associated protein beta chain [Solea senegalensis]KAG7507638.1 B-cell antigen receptor complex-associated beta chain-like [Solea senegalensis]